MSKFKTAIAVDVEAVKRLLPKGSYIHGVEWNKETQSVELTWEHDLVTTPYNFAADFPLAAMHGEEALPKYIKVSRGLKPQAPEKPAEPEAAPLPAPEIPSAPATPTEPEAATAASVRTEPTENIEKPRRRR